MAIYVKVWSILVYFTLTSHPLFSNHLVTVANFEMFIVSFGFILNLGKVDEFERISSNAPRGMDKNLWGSGLNRVNEADNLFASHTEGSSSFNQNS